MKKSTLSLLLALGVFFSLNAFAADKVDCFKMNYKNGRIKKSSKKECKRQWHSTEEAAIAAAKEKCKKKKREWIEGKGKDGKGMCINNKRALKLAKKVEGLENQAVANFCDDSSKADKSCKKIKKAFLKAYKKKCKAMFRNKEKIRRKSKDGKALAKLKDMFKIKERKNRKKEFMAACNKAANGDFVKNFFAN